MQKMLERPNRGRREINCNIEQYWFGNIYVLHHITNCNSKKDNCCCI